MAQEAPVLYHGESQMIPMRDGIKLFTVVYTPVKQGAPAPILMVRTPYGARKPLPEDATTDMSSISYCREGYIIVYQDIRGKNQSEGKFEMHRPVIAHNTRQDVDESTDTYDTIDWLIKNLSNNNGCVGIKGVSYPGYLALAGTVNPHPALKAASPQAAMGDLFLGDDFHHNGAFRLSYGLEYSYGMEDTSGNDIDFGHNDPYDWYLKLGPLKNVNKKYFHGKISTWNNFVNHPNYDAFWQNESPLRYAKIAEVPMLHVGGYYDQEDLNGPQQLYELMEKSDTKKWNHLVLGPWNHGQWGASIVDSIGKISLSINTAEFFHDLELKWFNHYLKGQLPATFSEAYLFQTGSNRWIQYDTWPLTKIAINKLYLNRDNTLSFTRPLVTSGIVSYMSDPAHPVPYRQLLENCNRGSTWSNWHVEDQRFVYSRPDVASFVMDSLREDKTVTGKIVAHLFVSTTGSDADWVVKLIDAYPARMKENPEMSGYQLPVAMEVFRGRFRKSFSKPSPFIPGKPEEITIDLHTINHTFKKGHQIMVQVQSSWFPVIDRNPQKFMPNIFEAKEADFIKATHSIYCNSKLASYIELPVINENQ